MKLQKVLLFVLCALMLTTSVFAITIDSASIEDIDDYGFFSRYSEIAIETQTTGISTVDIEIIDSSSLVTIEEESYSADDSTSFSGTLSFASSLSDNTDYDLIISITGTDGSVDSTTLSGLTTDLISADMQSTTIPTEDSWYTTETISFEFEADDGLGSGVERSTINLVASDSSVSSFSEIVTSSTTTYAATVESGDLSEGEYSVAIFARDYVGNYADDRIDVSAIYVDRTSPVLTWITAQENEFETYNPTLELEVSDNLASEITCDFYLDEILVEEDGTVSVGTAEILLDTMSPGDYEADATCEDEAGNSITIETLSFTILDIEDPTISFNEPTISSVNLADGISEVDIEFYVEDDVGVADVELTVTDSLQTQTLSTTEVSSGLFQSSFELSTVQEGTVRISVTASDAAGNTVVDFTEIEYDITEPTIEFVTEDSGVSNDGDFDITFIPSDNVAEELSCALHSGEVGDVITLSGSGDYTFANGEETTITIEGIGVTGEFMYYVACADEVENAAGSSEQTFSVIDITAPVIAFESPADGDSYDASGSSMTATVAITDDFYLESSTVSYSLLDSSGVSQASSTLTDIGSDQFQFTFDFSGLDDGWYTVEVSAEDYDGNAQSESIQIGYDILAPTVTLAAESEAEQYSDLVFTYSAEDSISQVMSCSLYLEDSATMLYGIGSSYSLITEDVNNQEEATFEITKSIWDSVVGSQPVEGNHYFSVSCTDEAGLTDVSETLEIEFVDAEPTVEITSPSAESSFGTEYVDGSSTLTIGVEADDMIGSISFVELVILSDTLNNIPIMTDNSDGTYSYDLTDLVGLSDETVELTAIAYDDDGRDGASSSITILVDTTSPIVSLSDEPAITQQSSSNLMAVNVIDASSYDVTIADESGVVMGTASSTSLGQETIEVEYSTADYADESLVIIVTVEDDAGNIGEYTTETYIDATAPTFSEFTCSDVKQGSDFSCVCSADDDASSTALGSSVTTSVAADTSETGEITAVCTAVDSQGNSATSEATFDVSAVSSSSGSSGGGGGGGSSSSKRACADNIDNDGDGLVDLDDPGCSNSNDDSEIEIVCRESWVCTEWLACSIDGSQERTCYDTNACQFKEGRGQVDVVITSPMPSTSQSCEISDSAVIEEGSSDSVESEAEEGPGNSITGAVIGGTGNLKALVVPGIILLVIGIVTAGTYFVTKKK